MVDLESGAIVSASLYHGDEGDTKRVGRSLDEARAALAVLLGTAAPDAAVPAEVIGDKGMLGFSVYQYDPILLVTSEGSTSITVPNPPYVQLPIIKAVIEHLQGFNICQCTSVSATPSH